MASENPVVYTFYKAYYKQDSGGGGKGPFWNVWGIYTDLSQLVKACDKELQKEMDT